MTDECLLFHSQNANGISATERVPALHKNIQTLQRYQARPHWDSMQTFKVQGSGGAKVNHLWMPTSQTRPRFSGEDTFAVEANSVEDPELSTLKVHSGYLHQGVPAKLSKTWKFTPLGVWITATVVSLSPYISSHFLATSYWSTDWSQHYRSCSDPIFNIKSILLWGEPAGRSSTCAWCNCHLQSNRWPSLHW